METFEWAMSMQTLKKSTKRYAHFDHRTNMRKAWKYVSNPENIARHGFYPFIHFEKTMNKYHAKQGVIPKVRDICYAAHIDRCIYQYYSFLLNEKYNERIEREGIAEVPIAYRSDLKTNNILSAQKAIHYIKQCTSCYVIIGDFQGFFDNLNHNYLKKRWCDLLGLNKLPADHYAVYKNITRYSKWELEDIYVLNNLEDSQNGWKQLNKQKQVLPKEKFKQHKKKIWKNKAGYGIPQGSPISAVLANIYMMEVDKSVNAYVSRLNGMYMRYSDDFIIVIPESEVFSPQEDIPKICCIFNQTEGLTLQPEKTQVFRVTPLQIENCGNLYINNADCTKRFINFLGFTYDGKTVSIRSKTTSKYYYRMRRKAKTIVRNGGISRKGNHISCKNLYEKYSERGHNNYFTYVRRVEAIFGKNEPIRRDTRRHMQKIRKELKCSV